jgi:hypothetical protein
MCLCHHISHYRVIGNVHPGASLINIHWRCVKLERVSDYKTHLRHVLRVCVTDLIFGWSPYDINTRRTRVVSLPLIRNPR